MSDRVANFTHGTGDLVTPEQLRVIANNALNVKIEAPDFGSKTVGEIGATNKDARGWCAFVSDAVHPHMPEGSHVLAFSRTKKYSTNFHAVNLVPTTEGLHVVDFTHKQFHHAVAFPLIEPLEKFMNRKAIKRLSEAAETEEDYTTHYRKTEEHRLDKQNKMPFDDEGLFGNF
jgi:hypothetical protein